MVPHFTSYSRHLRRGVAALPTVLIIAMVVVIASIGIASSGFVESLVSFGDYESKQAFAVAEAGAQDALKRLVRDKTCTCNYTLTLGSGTATITVSGTNPKTIASVGAVGNKKRKIEVTVSWDGNDKASQTAWQEVTN